MTCIECGIRYRKFQQEEEDPPSLGPSEYCPKCQALIEGRIRAARIAPTPMQDAEKKRRIRHTSHNNKRELPRLGRGSSTYTPITYKIVNHRGKAMGG